MQQAASVEQGEAQLYNKTQSEHVLRKQFSQLEEEAKELRNEVRVLKNHISRNDVSRESGSVAGGVNLGSTYEQISQANERGSGWLAQS